MKGAGRFLKDNSEVVAVWFNRFYCIHEFFVNLIAVVIVDWFSGENIDHSVTVNEINWTFTVRTCI